MKQKVFSKIILPTILFIVFILIYTKFNNQEKVDTGVSFKIYETICGKYKKGEIVINQQILLVDIADDECKMILGLSGKSSLIDEGMFFVFENVGNHSFWMKDMNFPIDIIWINETFDVVGIEKDVSPSTYPESFGATYKALYVLEVPAQYSDKNNIKIGNKIVFTQK